MIKINQVDFSYGKQYIFKEFSLEIKKGETTLVTGINGSGKTTLLRLMAGVLFPQKGRVEYAPALGNNPRKKIAFISDKMRLYENLTLGAAMALHARVFGIGEFDMELVEKTGLKMGKKIEQLSAGQKLIFHLSLLLSSQPEVLLVDEVIHTLDAFLRELFLEKLLEAIAERNVTLVLVNLNYHDIEKIPQRVILLKGGKIFLDEDPENLKERVKKVVSPTGIPGVPVIYQRRYADQTEYYLYPFDAKTAAGLEGKQAVIKDLNLNDIIKAFIGGEYA